MKKQLLALTLALTAVSAQAGWQIRTFNDEMTDQKTTFAIADNYAIGYKCDGLYFLFNSYIDQSMELKKIAVRVDKNKPFIFEGIMWKSDRMLAVPLTDAGVGALLHQMKLGNTIRFRVDDYSGRPQDNSASLVGFTANFNQIKCKK